jgi:hypothetical protein
MSAAELEKYQDGLDRCQRIRDKNEQIQAEIKFNRRRIKKELGFDVSDEAVVMEEGVLGALSETIVKKLEEAFSEIDTTNAIRIRRGVIVENL